MRWVKATILPIALASAALGGYSITALLAVEARHDAALNKLTGQLASLQSALTKANEQGISLPANQSELSPRKNAIVSLRKEVALLRGELMSSIDEGDGDNGAWETDDDEESATFEAEAIQIEEDFDYETVDTDWGNQAELDIQSAIASGAPKGTHVTIAECRSTLCRIEIDFDDARTKLEGMQSLALLMPWSGESMLRNDETTGDNSVVFYVAREGESLSGELE